jgi:uncharacterized RDD family membrane protein YckC
MSYPPQNEPNPGQNPYPGQDPYQGQTPPGAPYQGQQYGAPPPGYGQPAAYGAINYASWIQRVGAYLIDAICVAPFSILGSILGRGDNGLNALYFVFTLLGIVVTGYNRWYQAGKTGQSWGKKALGIRLVGEQTGQPIGPGMAFLRDLAHIVDGIICYIGFLFPLWDAKKQTIADKIVKTLVIH